VTGDIVLDTSYLLAVVMGDEATPAQADKVMAARLLAPAIWPLEVANTFLVSQRRGRINAEQLQRLVEVVAALDVQVAATPSLSVEHWCQFATAHGLTPYDAQYLDLALQQRCGIATCDVRLAQAAARAGVPVFS